jgi:hypothetical protein
MKHKSRLKLIFEIAFSLAAVFVAVRALVFIFSFVARVVCGKQGFLFQMS